MLLYRFSPSLCPHKERLLPAAEDPRSTGQFGRCWSFFMPRPKSVFWHIKMDELSKQYTAFTDGNLGFFECDHMPFGLSNVPAMFQWLMQNCFGELNPIYCLIYLDDIVIFLQTTEEHHCLCTVFDQFREHNLNWSHHKATFSEKKSPIWNIESQKMGCNPVTWTWKQLQSACCLKFTQRFMHFLVWLVTIGCSLRGSHALHSHSVNILARGGASRKLEWVSLSRRCLEGFQSIEAGVCDSPWFWLLLTTLNHYCWRTDACPRMDWESVMSQKLADRQYHPCHLWQQSPLCLMRITTTQLSSSF